MRKPNEWQDPEDRTACPNRVPSMHDWRKSMPYTGPDGVKVMLWLCSACLSPSYANGTRPT